MDKAGALLDDSQSSNDLEESKERFKIKIDSDHKADDIRMFHESILQEEDDEAVLMSYDKKRFSDRDDSSKKNKDN